MATSTAGRGRDRRWANEAWRWNRPEQESSQSGLTVRLRHCDLRTGYTKLSGRHGLTARGRRLVRGDIAHPHNALLPLRKHELKESKAHRRLEVEFARRASRPLDIRPLV